MTDKTSNETKRQQCSVCGFDNAEGVLTCLNCGAQLVGARKNLLSEPTPRPIAQAADGVATESFTVQMQRPVKCPKCGQYNRPTNIVCEHCGSNLTTGEGPRVSTVPLTNPDEHATLLESPFKKDKESTPLPGTPIVPRLSTEELRALQTAGADLFEDDMILRLEVTGAPTPIMVYPSAETVIGRRDPVSAGVPDVDLTAYAGYRMGVSRQHAVLRLRENVLDIRDLGSSNGTFINGVRLSPHQPHPLRDGDELGLGKMTLRVIFQSGGRRP